MKFTARWFALAVLILAITAPSASAALKESARYTIANGCYALQSNSGQTMAPDAGPFFLEPTTLGEYLFYGKAANFLAAASDGSVSTADDPSTDTEWRVEVVNGAYRITSIGQKKVLTTSGGALKVGSDAGGASRFTLKKATGCTSYPEITLNVSGGPYKGPTSYGETRGFIEGHIHMFAYEAFGKRFRCGRPWHKYGVTHALVDCEEHQASGGCVAPGETVFSGGTTCHDPTGWPTFGFWPKSDSLTHEQTYYRWLERAWRGGLRLYVNLYVDNKALCDAYPLRSHFDCNEMKSVRLQARRMRELQDYIDAQSGGPGKGYFRIVTNPFQARRVINSGKLAVVQGIEVSQLFDCNHVRYQPTCDKAMIDRQLAEVYTLGVRQMELVNKFDNALAGVAGDPGEAGIVTNTGNKKETDTYWDLETCKVGQGDKEQVTAVPGEERDALLVNGLQAFLPPGATPIYPSAPHCNTRGLTDLGEHLIRRMMQRKMIIDPDHLSQAARDEVLALMESRDYSGAFSSHSWSNDQDYPRIYRLGGTITPSDNSTTGFIRDWKRLRAQRDKRFLYGIGYGADMNGLSRSAGPRADNKTPVKYPFKSFDGSVTIRKQKSGTQEYDINEDGVAHYGLFPDWIEDLRKLAGPAIVRDLTRGAEAYLQAWERASGIEAEHCRSARANFASDGIDAVRLGVTSAQVLRRIGQPRSRGRAWRYCMNDGGKRTGDLVPVFTRGGRVTLVTSQARGHRIRGIRRGSAASDLRGRARPFGAGVLVEPAARGRKYVYGVRNGRVTFIGVGSRAASKSRSALRAHLRLARVL